ncbi:pyruvate,orthophosphate dikinase [Nocardia kruczakiae]|uniref:Pyruvate,orthophosphate dikinase n=1 Tax=Nocardia kruczakiae TaxID=261477 RepID=A0ABU1XMB7_9NOCA|nr:PEP/pyruvate-binding domain-containing protein [Nocardia kruczakiae]MDR7171705.1 pyruvate,orthophosphate dikinase [Nocardia kruczakiae]
MSHPGIERFETPQISRALFGGKGFFLTKLAEMNYPVPPFRILPGERLRQTGGPLDEIARLIRELRKEAAATMAADRATVAFAVRSSAPVSMPGMMDTLLCIGLTPENVPALAERLGSQESAWRAVVSGARALCVHVAGVPEADLPTGAPERIHPELIDIYQQRTGARFPVEPAAQVKAAVDAVAASWNNRRAREYRAAQGISEADRPSVVVQAMAYGTAATASGSGVVFSHDPLTGMRGLHGEYLPAATGESLVGGTATPANIEVLADSAPGAYGELAATVDELFCWLTLIVEVEFVVESGKLWLVQVRPAVAAERVHNTVTVDAWRAGLLDRPTALRRLRPAALFDHASPHAAAGHAPLLARGIAASTGVASGRLARDTAAVLAAAGAPTVLLRPSTEPEDFAGMLHATAVVTQEGGSGSHAAVVARELGKPAVVGARFVDPEWPARAGGELVTVCGTTGRIWHGLVPAVEGHAPPWPSDLIGEPLRTTVVDSLDELPTAAADSAGDGLVVTADPDLACRAGARSPIAFVCGAGPADRPWLAELPDIPLRYVVVTSPAQRRFVCTLLAIRETLSPRSETQR